MCLIIRKFVWCVLVVVAYLFARVIGCMCVYMFVCGGLCVLVCARIYLCVRLFVYAFAGCVLMWLCVCVWLCVCLCEFVCFVMRLRCCLCVCM